MADDAVIFTRRIASMLLLELEASVPGSGSTHCAACRHLVVLSPSSVEYVAGHPATKVVCMQCMPRYTAERQDDLELQVLPGAGKELGIEQGDMEKAVAMFNERAQRARRRRRGR